MNLLRVFLRTILFRLGFGVRPIQINWLITWRCNLACNYCNIGRSNFQELKSRELCFEEAKKIVPQFKALGAKFITFAGGEPLIYEDIFKVIRYCKEHKFIVGLVTNANLISEGIAKELALAGTDHIHVSLDYPGVLHDQIRGSQNCFSKVEAGINNLLKYKYVSNYHIGLATVVSGFNFDKLEDVYAYARKRGLDSVGLQPFFANQMRHNQALSKFIIPKEKIPELSLKIKFLMRQYPDLNRNSSYFMRNITSYFFDNRMKGAVCFGGGLTVNVFPEGTIGSCTYLKADKAGSLKEHTFKELFYSRPYRQLLKRVKRRDCPTCWCAVVHEFNIFFSPVDILRSLRLLRVARDGR